MENVGRNPVPMELVLKRRAYAVELCRAGFSYETVKNKINELAAKNNWGEVGLRTLHRDVASYYREQSEKVDKMVDQARYLRENLLASMEATMEMARVHIAKNDTDGTWSKGERTKAVRAFFDMQKGFMEVNGWNYAKTANATMMGVRPIEPRSVVDMYDDAAEALMENPGCGNELSRVLKELCSEIRASEGMSPEELASPTKNPDKIDG